MKVKILGKSIVFALIICLAGACFGWGGYSFAQKDVEIVRLRNGDRCWCIKGQSPWEYNLPEIEKLLEVLTLINNGNLEEAKMASLEALKKEAQRAEEAYARLPDSHPSKKSVKEMLKVFNEEIERTEEVAK